MYLFRVFDMEIAIDYLVVCERGCGVEIIHDPQDSLKIEKSEQGRPNILFTVCSDFFKVRA